MIKYSENYKTQETEVECECKNITCIAHGYTKPIYCKCGIQVWPKQGEKAQDMSDTFKKKNPNTPITGAYMCRCKNCLKDFGSTSAATPLCPECMKGIALGNTETFIASPSVCVVCQKNFNAAFQNIRVCQECFDKPAVPTTGVKHDAAKPRHSLLPPHALDAIIAVLEYGATKYGARNWTGGMAYSRPWDAAKRHMWAWWKGEDVDPESGLPHLAHAIASLMFLIDYQANNTEGDDRHVPTGK